MYHKNNNKKRHGSALEHGKAHTKDHQSWSRRGFLKSLGLTTGGAFLLGNLPISATATSPLEMALSGAESDRVLVLIRFKGGNDGVNTIVPVYDYGTYSSLRPSIAIPQSQILSLTPEMGMPNTMQPLMPFWNDGKMKVVNNVGYPDQNLSHFRSSDIWGSASDADVVDTSGWMGRYFNDLYPDFLANPPETPPAVQIGGAGNVVFNNFDNISLAMTVTDPNQLFEIAQNGQLYDVANVPDCYYGEQVGYLRSVSNSTFFYAETINEAYEASNNSVEYQNNNLAQQLALVARLIKGNLGTKLYMVTLDGFDTHADQPGRHPVLMNQLAQAVSDFYEDLSSGSYDEDVLCMTYSEFGRRVEQNASNGTDHGAAAPMMLFGAGLNGNGLLGGLTNLGDLDINNNLQYHTDFRQVYATIMEQWLCIGSDTVDSVLGQPFDRLYDLGVECGEFVGAPIQTAPNIEHRALYLGQGQLQIEYTLAAAATVKVEVINMLGQPVATVFSGYQGAGRQSFTHNMGSRYLPVGQYLYRILVGKVAYSGKVGVLR